MKHKIRKFSVHALIGFLLVNLLSSQVSAQSTGLHDTVAQTGAVYLTGSSGSDGVVTKFDPASTPNPYAATTVKTYSGAANVLSVSFMPNGDMVVLKAYNKLYCYTYASNYADSCSWSTSSGYTVAGSNVLIAFLRFDALGNIWASNYGLSPIQSGREIYRIVTSTPPSQSTYDASFGGTVNFAPFPVTIDHFGHVWFSSYADQANVGNSKIYCITQAMAPCTGGAFDANGGIDLGSGGYFGGLTVGSDNMLYALQYGPLRTIKKITTNGQIIASTSTYAISTDVQSIALDADNNVWMAWTSGTDGKLSCFKSSDLTPCTGVASPQFNDLSQTTSVFVDNSYNLWVGSMGTSGNSRLYCFKSTDGTACSTTGNFVQDELYPSSYYLVAPLMTTASYQYQLGDETGMIVAGAFAGYAADSNALITATVDPTISLTLSSGACNFSLLFSMVGSCQYDITTSTNALEGLSVNFSASSAALISGTDDIDACTGTNCDGDSTSGVTVGSEEYGFYVSSVGSGHSAAGFTVNAQPLPTTMTTVISASGPHAASTSTITHLASVSNLTPKGVYSQTVTITVVGRF